MAETTMEDERADLEDGDEELEAREEFDGDDSETEAGASASSGTAGWALRGAVVGAVAGAAVGAGLGVVFAARPDFLDSAKETVGGAGRDVAKSAGLAVGQVLANRSVANLVTTGDGERSAAMKETAREAAAAAAGAARDTLISMQSGSAKS
jgi:hypothetical protein